MLERFGRWMMSLLIAIDHVGFVVLCAVPYVVLNACACPDPDETISACVGYHAERGRPWALIAEKVINTLFWFTPGHCRRAIAGDERRADELKNLI